MVCPGWQLWNRTQATKKREYPFHPKRKSGPAAQAGFRQLFQCGAEWQRQLYFSNQFVEQQQYR